MKPLLRICLFNVLIAGMVAGCSDEQDVSSSDLHSADHAVTHDHTSPDHKPKAVSEAKNKPVTRSAEAHTHGTAELAIVLEKDIVTVEFDSPLYNILGFEHAPETEAQTKAVRQAELQLERSETLFKFNASANCVATSNDLHVALFDEKTHEDDHGHDEEDEHGHDDDTHQDILLTYEFKCQNSAKLTNVRINLFEFFPELSDIDVIYLGPATQVQATVTRQQNQMDITP